MTDPADNIAKQQQLLLLKRQATDLKKQVRTLEKELHDNDGIRCPECGCGHLYTLQTVDIPGQRRRRYKECRNCGKRIRTVEKVEE